MDAKEDLKRCARCGGWKPPAEFARKCRDLLQPYCRPCQAEYHRSHYRKNPAAYKAAAKRRLKRMRALIREGKDRPCADCGLCYPYYVMDFDHREPDAKVANVNKLIWFSEAKLREEIAKCDVVCANCHRERTYRRRQALGLSVDELEETLD
jgi:hypothetical protein